MRTGATPASAKHPRTRHYNRQYLKIRRFRRNRTHISGKINADDIMTWLKKEKQEIDDRVMTANAQVGEAIDLKPLVEAQAADANAFFQRAIDDTASMKHKRQQRKAQLEREKIAEMNWRSSIVKKDAKREWRVDALEWMTDEEYAEWYDNYYFDPDNPF